MTIAREQWARLGGLMFVARRLVEGLWSSQHVSIRYGAGQEFHEYRSYCPGDDPAEIDWKLYGRSDRYFVRRHRQLTDLHAYLMLDGTASMDFAGLDQRGQAIVDPAVPSKWRYGAELAAALAYLMIRQSDRAGLGLFSDRLFKHLPPAGTWSHLQGICAALEAPEKGIRTFSGAHATSAGIAASLAQAHALMRRRGLVILISDLLDQPAGLFDGLSRFRHDRFEVIVFQVLTPQELDLRRLSGLHLRLLDAETGRKTPADIAALRRDYCDRMAGHLATLARGCAARGIDYQLLTTDQPVVTALRRYLVRRSAMMR